MPMIYIRTNEKFPKWKRKKEKRAGSIERCDFISFNEYLSPLYIRGSIHTILLSTQLNCIELFLLLLTVKLKLCLLTCFLPTKQQEDSLVLTCCSLWFKEIIISFKKKRGKKKEEEFMRKERIKTQKYIKEKIPHCVESLLLFFHFVILSCCCCQ